MSFSFEEYPEKAFTSHLQLLPSRFAKRALSCWLIFRAGKFTSKGSDNPFTDFDLEREALLKTNMNYCSVLACWREWFGNGVLKIPWCHWWKSCQHSTFCAIGRPISNNCWQINQMPDSKLQIKPWNQCVPFEKVHFCACDYGLRFLICSSDFQLVLTFRTVTQKFRKG